MRKYVVLLNLFFLTFSVSADVQTTPEYECCVKTNSKLTRQIENQNKIISTLEEINKTILLNKDTLNHTVKIEIDKIKEPEKGCSICSILGSIIGAIISGAIAIFIFIQGRKNEKRKEKQKLIDFGEELYTLIKNIVANSRKQTELLNILITSIREKPYIHGKYQHISFNLLKRAQSFDTSLTFNTFKALKQEKKLYIKFYTSIDYLLESFLNVDHDYDRNNSEVITPLSNNFITLRQEIFKICTDYIELKRREQNTNDNLYVFVNKLVIDYYSSPDIPDAIDIKYDVEMLIRPLKIELLAKYRDYDIANEILNIAKQAGDIYQTIVIENNKLANAISSQIASLDKSILNLEEIEIELRPNYER